MIKWDLFWRCKDGSVSLSMQHINQMKDKNPMFNAKDAEKSFDKFNIHSR